MKEKEETLKQKKEQDQIKNSYRREVYNKM